MIHGNSQETVSGAVEALGSILRECVTRESSQEKLFMVEPPPKKCRDHVVEMIEANHPKSPSRAFGIDPKIAQKVAQVSKSTSPLKEVEEWEREMARFFRTNARVLELAFSDCMSRMLYYRGKIRIRSKIGVFIFEKFRWTPKGAKTQNITRFIENMRESSTVGTLNGV